MYKVETVDKMADSEKIKEAVWCDHVQARGMWAGGHRPVIVVTTPDLRIVIEEGKVKLLCPSCLMKAIQLPLIV